MHSFRYTEDSELLGLKDRTVSEVRLKVSKPLRYWNYGFESRTKYVKFLIFLLSLEGGKRTSEYPKLKAGQDSNRSTIQYVLHIAQQFSPVYFATAYLLASLKPSTKNKSL